MQKEKEKECVRTNLIKAKMVEFNMTQEDLANKLNISRSALLSKLNGRFDFKTSEIIALAELFNVKTSFFIN